MRLPSCRHDHGCYEGLIRGQGGPSRWCRRVRNHDTHASAPNKGFGGGAAQRTNRSRAPHLKKWTNLPWSALLSAPPAAPPLMPLPGVAAPLPPFAPPPLPSVDVAAAAAGDGGASAAAAPAPSQAPAAGTWRTAPTTRGPAMARRGGGGDGAPPLLLLPGPGAAAAGAAVTGLLLLLPPKWGRHGAACSSGDAARARIVAAAAGRPRLRCRPPNSRGFML